MLRVRFILAWLLMVAIPLQGFAATTMLLCKGAQAPIAAAGSHAHSHNDSASPQDHGKHAATGISVADKAQDAGASHKCGVCASCCHVVAIIEFAGQIHFAPLPQAESLSAAVQIRARPSTVPDKPPRA